MSLRRSARVSNVTTALAAVDNSVTNGTLAKKATTVTTTLNKGTKRKPSAKRNADNVDAAPNGNNVPTTTPKKRARIATSPEPKGINADAPSTPLPSSTRKPRASATTTPQSISFGHRVRPVEPHATNAPLKTPGGSRHVLSRPPPPANSPAASPSKALDPSSNARNTPDTALPSVPHGLTTANLLEKATAHLLAVEPKLQPLIAKFPCTVFSARGLSEEVDPWKSLASGIMAQQVSGAAASSIKRKFCALFHHPAGDDGGLWGDGKGEGEEGDGGGEQHANAAALPFPSPDVVAKTPLTTLRTAGLSQRKAEYIQGLAEKFVSGELSVASLIEASDQEVMERLVAVRGLGRWSVEMFACFGLKRTDVFSTGDLGVQRGMAAFYGRDVGRLKAKGGGKWKYMSEKDMLEYSAKFAPYRSLFMWYMWRVEEVNTDALEKQ